MLRLDGSEFLVERAAACVPWNGQTSLLAVIRDITDRKEAENELRRSQSEAVTANRATSEFLANMSHELRTPLNAIIGFSEVIGNETFGPAGHSKYTEYARHIHHSGEHLLALINDILDLSEIETGESELEEEDIDVAELARAVMTLVASRAAMGGVDLESNVPDYQPPMRADERKLKQILINLLSNGIKFTESGGVVTLDVRCGKDGGFVFRVSDTGIGMAPEDIPKAMAPFGQIDGDLNRKYEGNGLGLPLIKQLTAMHGGSMELHSEVGTGTAVTIRFPAHRTIESPPLAEARSAAAG